MGSPDRLRVIDPSLINHGNRQSPVRSFLEANEINPYTLSSEEVPDDAIVLVSGSGSKHYLSGLSYTDRRPIEIDAALARESNNDGQLGNKVVRYTSNGVTVFGVSSGEEPHNLSVVEASRSKLTTASIPESLGHLVRVAVDSTVTAVVKDGGRRKTISIGKLGRELVNRGIDVRNPLQVFEATKKLIPDGSMIFTQSVVVSMDPRNPESMVVRTRQIGHTEVVAGDIDRASYLGLHFAYGGLHQQILDLHNGLDFDQYSELKVGPRDQILDALNRRGEKVIYQAAVAPSPIGYSPARNNNH